jgi:glycosidase
MLANPDHVEHALAILLTTGGTPSVYAGDEAAYRGIKEERFGGDDAVRPEFGSPHEGVGEHGQQVFRAHQHLIGLRRRHPWLRTARTTPLHVTNHGYVYATQNGDNALVVALNIGSEAMRVSLPELGFAAAEVVAGSGAPGLEVLIDAVIPAHGWLVLAPR